MYRSKNYTARSLESVFAEIQLAAIQSPNAHRVFLADGDALGLSTEHLVAILQKLNSAFPKLTRVSCYATPINIQRKSISELEQLHHLKLSLLYFGLESGSDLILRKITKGSTQKRMQEVLIKANDSGMKVSATVILGLGGSTRSQEHIDGTIELLNSAPVTYLSTLQLYLENSMLSEFYKKFAEPFNALDDQGILQEQERLISGLNPAQPIIFRSNHASNALALAGNIPKDKLKLLSHLKDAMNGTSPLRPMFMRGL
jgi:coproporphyrinogen III oxidase-like Fe-S oxidoreductase